MLDLFAEFATDETLETQGAYRSIKGKKFLIARANNRAYAKMLTELVNKHQSVLDQKDDESDKMSDKIMIEVIAKTILKGWEGTMVVERGGEPVSYSLENAMKALKIKDFRVEVMRQADEREAYRVKVDEEQEKNS